MVKGMFAVVNVMLSLTSVMRKPPDLCHILVHTVVKLYTLGSFCFMGKLGFLKCDDICMCFVNNQFTLLPVVIGLYVTLSWYSIWWVQWLR